MNTLTLSSWSSSLILRFGVVLAAFSIYLGVLSLDASDKKVVLRRFPTRATSIGVIVKTAHRQNRLD